MGNRIRTDTGRISECVFFNADEPVMEQATITVRVEPLLPGGTGTTPGAFATATARDNAIAAVNNNLKRINEIETTLKNLGILP